LNFVSLHGTMTAARPVGGVAAEELVVIDTAVRDQEEALLVLRLSLDEGALGLRRSGKRALLEPLGLVGRAEEHGGVWKTLTSPR